MADEIDSPDRNDDAKPATGMPGWVKVFLIVAILVVVAFVVTRLVGVEHGPGLHGP